MKIGDFYYGTNVGARSPKALNVFEVFSDFVTFFYQKRLVLSLSLSGCLLK
jgi:hypothetical protein